MSTSNPPDITALWKPSDLRRFFQNEFTEKTFTNWRCAGIGPPYVKVGTRVFYRPESVREWAKERERTTSPVVGAA